MPKKSFRSRLDRPPEFITIDARMAGKFGTKKGDRMLIPSPRDVDTLMKKVRKGRVTTVNHIRESLASDFKVDFVCPLTTGIFIGIAAKAAEEDAAEGKKVITPYWRTLKSDGKLNPKYPGGVEAQARRLKAEGHTILPNRAGTPSKVSDFEKVVQKL